MNFSVYESDERVAEISPALRTRFRSRAERRCRKLNGQRLVPFYRYEVIEEDGSFVVAAFQNLAAPPKGA